MISPLHHMTSHDLSSASHDHMISYLTAACNCSVGGTVNGSQSCDRLTGQCPCRSNVGQRDCSGCLPGFYNQPGQEGCLTCKTLSPSTILSAPVLYVSSVCYHIPLHSISSYLHGTQPVIVTRWGLGVHSVIAVASAAASVV